MRRLGQRAPLSFTIYDCAFDAQGDYWITASLGGMARFRGGRWERMFGPAGPVGGAFVPKSMLADARGRLFVHWNERTLSLLDGRAHDAFPIPFGEYLPYDVVLHSVAPDTLFVAGRFGLARLRHGRFQTLYAREAPLFSDVKGMVRTPAGDMWFAGPGGIVRMTAAQLERAFANPSQSLSMELFDAADGLRSRPHSHSRNAIVQGGDGRLWIATQTGTLWLDPANISHSTTPPRVAVSALSADRVYRDPSSMTLPAGTSNIEIDFAVLAFSNPRSARVRYRIEGLDPDWIEAGTRRQAFYTNLPPGTHRFQVIAANAGRGLERGGRDRRVRDPADLLPVALVRRPVHPAGPGPALAALPPARGAGRARDGARLQPAPGRTRPRADAHRTGAARYAVTELSGVDAPFPECA